MSEIQAILFTSVNYYYVFGINYKAIYLIF